MNPLFVALDTLDLTTDVYGLMAFSAPEPELDDQASADLEATPDADYWPRDLHYASSVTMTVKVDTHGDEAAALTAVNALRNAAHSDATLYVRLLF